MSGSSTDCNEPSTSRGVRKSNVLTASEVKIMWNIGKIFHTFDTREKCIAFAEEQGLIPNRKLCRVHKTAMAVVQSEFFDVGRVLAVREQCPERRVLGLKMLRFHYLYCRTAGSGAKNWRP
ncbi:uncharacterized protein LOC128922594 [Zeugodacus cucurbitae]|uniref:uncharacterized protein LOC128922594 n=1 Tax=Zeugodacus cucurbitae TaxID=28588 RepID=UPI0023D96049|nr:uncharacterized protein LOC128922594 [Zeugodacus cucurbitae]